MVSEPLYKPFLSCKSGVVTSTFMDVVGSKREDLCVAPGVVTNHEGSVTVGSLSFSSLGCLLYTYIPVSACFNSVFAGASHWV